MAVIREDVVSIGFSVEDNPFGELTSGINDIKAKLGVLDETTSDLKKVTSEAKLAGNGLEDMMNGIHAPPGLDDTLGKTKKIEKEAKKAEVTFTGLTKGLVKTGKIKLDSGVKKLSDNAKKAVSEVQTLDKKVKDAASGLKKINLPRALNSGLGSAVVGAGKLGKSLKEVASANLKNLASNLKSVASNAASASKALGGGALKGLKSLSIGAAGGILAAGTAMSGASAVGVNSAANYQSALNSIQAQTGATAGETKELGNIMSGLYVDNFGEGYGDLANSISQVKQISQSGGAELEGLSRNALLVRDTFEFDVTESVRSAKMMMDQFGVTGDEAYNLIAQGAQKGLNKNGDLLDTLNEYGVHFKQMGFSSDEMMNMLVNGAETGTFSVDKLGDAVKEFGIRSKDGSKTTTEAFQMLGLNSNQLTADFATGGEKGKLAFEQVTKALADMKDPVKQNTAGVNLFGTMWEDLGAEGVLAMSRFTGSVTTGTDALEQINKVKYNDLKSNFESLKRSAVDGLLNPIGKLLTPSLNQGINDLKGFVSEAKKLLEDGFQLDDVGKLADVAGNMVAKVISGVVGKIPGFIDLGVQMVDSLVDGIMNNEGKITSSLTKGLASLGKGILKIAPKLAVAGITIIASLATGAAQELPTLIPLAVDAVNTIINGLSQYAPQFINAGMQQIGYLASGLGQAAPSLISSAITLVMTLFQGIIGNLGPIIDGALALVNGLVNGIISNLPLIISSAAMLVVGLISGISGNAGKLVDGAISLVQSLLTGIISNLPAIIEGAVQIVVALVVGLIQAVPQLIVGVDKLIDAIRNTVLQTDWLQLGWDIVKGVGNGFLNGIKGLFDKNKGSGKESMQGLAQGMDEGKPLVESSAGKTSQGITTKIDGTNLYGSGQNIMSGLNNGMLSMQGTLNSTAGNIGSGISKNLNGSLDIHSPSRVTEETGKYTDLGLIKGMEGMSGKVESTARDVGDATAKNISPYKSHYSPDTSQSANSTNNASQTNNWNPVFNLTLNGASASDSNERKVKRWVKDVLKESMEGMGRTNPRLQEV